MMRSAQDDDDGKSSTLSLLQTLLHCNCHNLHDIHLSDVLDGCGCGFDMYVIVEFPSDYPSPRALPSTQPLTSSRLPHPPAQSIQPLPTQRQARPVSARVQGNMLGQASAPSASNSDEGSGSDSDSDSSNSSDSSSGSSNSSDSSSDSEEHNKQRAAARAQGATTSPRNATNTVQPISSISPRNSTGGQPTSVISPRNGQQAQAIISPRNVNGQVISPRNGQPALKAAGATAAGRGQSQSQSQGQGQAAGVRSQTLYDGQQLHQQQQQQQQRNVRAQQRTATMVDMHTPSTLTTSTKSQSPPPTTQSQAQQQQSQQLQQQVQYQQPVQENNNKPGTRRVHSVETGHQYPPNQQVTQSQHQAPIHRLATMPIQHQQQQQQQQQYQQQRNNAPGGISSPSPSSPPPALPSTPITPSSPYDQQQLQYNHAALPPRSPFYTGPSGKVCALCEQFQAQVWCSDCAVRVCSASDAKGLSCDARLHAEYQSQGHIHRRILLGDNSGRVLPLINAEVVQRALTELRISQAAAEEKRRAKLAAQAQLQVQEREKASQLPPLPPIALLQKAPQYWPPELLRLHLLSASQQQQQQQGQDILLRNLADKLYELAVDGEMMLELQGIHARELGLTMQEWYVVKAQQAILRQLSADHIESILPEAHTAKYTDSQMFFLMDERNRINVQLHASR